MILEQYRGVFEKIYIFSPSINDDGWIPVKKYIEEDLGVNTERERAYYDEWDEAALRDIIQRQRKITKTSKKLEMKKLYQVLIICDNFADSPQLHKPHGALDTLFVRGRRLQISTWVSSQKLRLISAAVRVNQQFLCCWRLCNQHELDAVIEELSALLPKQACAGSTSRRLGSPIQLPLRLLPQAKESNVPHALRRAFCTGKRSRWERRAALPDALEAVERISKLLDLSGLFLALLLHPRRDRKSLSYTGASESAGSPAPTALWSPTSRRTGAA